MLRRSIDLPTPFSGLADVVIQPSQMPPPAAADAAELAALVDDWCFLVRYGAFCDPRDGTADSTLLSKAQIADGPARLAWSMRFRCVHGVAYHVLSHALYAYSQTVHALNALIVQPTGLSPSEVLEAADVDATIYPPPSSRLGFAVDRPNMTIGGGARRVGIDFTAPFGEAAFRQLEQAIERWEMVAFCAYPQHSKALRSGRCAIFNGAVNALDRQAAEIVFDDFGGAERAWSSLLNLLDSFSRSVQKIETVTIE